MLLIAKVKFRQEDSCRNLTFVSKDHAISDFTDLTMTETRTGYGILSEDLERHRNFTLVALYSFQAGIYE